MKFSEWRSLSNRHEDKVAAAYASYQEAKKNRDDFLHDTIGVVPGDVATLQSTCGMIEKVMAMKEEEKT